MQPNAMLETLRQRVPLLVTLGALFIMGYPIALLFGLPLARRDMQDLRKWQRDTFTAAPLAQIPDADTDTLQFTEGLTTPALLTFSDAPVSTNYRLTDNQLVLAQPLSPSDMVTWQDTLEPLGSGIYTLTEIPDTRPDIYPDIYVDGVHKQAGVLAANEVPDGQRTVFTFALADTDALADIDTLENTDLGRVLINDQVLDEGTYTVNTANNRLQVTLENAPPFNSDVRTIRGDYAWLASDQIVFNTPPAGDSAVQATQQVMRLAARLEGDLEGNNRTFTLPRNNVVESDNERHILVGNTLLSNDNERPEERVDGETSVFTFASDRGIITLDGALLQADLDFTRDGNTIMLRTPPARNARLRQHPDYLISDPTAGEVLLATPPLEPVWTSRFTYYARPSCGQTWIACFFALPQHPVPFPHWIVARAPAFVQKFPLSDERNVFRAIAYTTTGTLASLLLGGLLGTMLAVVFVLVRPLEQALLPWVIASQTIPIIALVPVLLLVLGNLGITIQTSLLPTALIGGYITFFPVTVGTVKGLRSVDPLALDLMTSYAASPLDVFMKLRFPAAVPFFFTSLKLGAAAALVGALVAETESNNARGLGFQILGQVQSGNVADVWLLLLVSALLGILLVAIVGLVERLVAPWLSSGSGAL